MVAYSGRCSFSLSLCSFFCGGKFELKISSTTILGCSRCMSYAIFMTNAYAEDGTDRNACREKISLNAIRRNSNGSRLARWRCGHVEDGIGGSAASERETMIMIHIQRILWNVNYCRNCVTTPLARGSINRVRAIEKLACYIISFSRCTNRDN